MLCGGTNDGFTAKMCITLRFYIWTHTDVALKIAEREEQKRVENSTELARTLVLLRYERAGDELRQPAPPREKGPSDVVFV